MLISSQFYNLKNINVGDSIVKNESSLTFDGSVSYITVLG